MTESRQLRIAKLTAEVDRQRHILANSKVLSSKGPPSMKERLAAQLQKVEKELRALEHELHQLRVEQIREESGKIE